MNYFFSLKDFLVWVRAIIIRCTIFSKYLKRNADVLDVVNISKEMLVVLYISSIGNIFSKNVAS